MRRKKKKNKMKTKYKKKKKIVQKNYKYQNLSILKCTENSHFEYINTFTYTKYS